MRAFLLLSFLLAPFASSSPSSPPTWMEELLKSRPFPDPEDASAAFAHVAADYVETRAGLVRGDTFSRHRKFLGVPFGQAPVDELRFASPVPAASWAPETYNATEIPPACPGTLQSLFSILPNFEISEDCLYLNVYAPSRERLKEPVPVLLWIYGGAFMLGDSYEVGLYDGSYLAENRDVVVVTINYRLGPFGFLVYDEGVRGNFAIEDQRLAMQWVQDNILNFGGDPKKVTLFGESAGAMSIGAHLASPLSTGLFHSVILQSNALGLNFKKVEPALNQGRRFAKVLGCEQGGLECLRGLGWRKIAYAHIPVFPFGIENLMGDILPWTPTLDGINLSKNPIDAIRDGEFHDVPAIWGFNSDEMTLFEGLLTSGFDLLSALLGIDLSLDIGPIAYRLIINFLFKGQGDMVLGRYPPSLLQNNLPLLAKVLTEYIFQCSSRQAAMNMAKNAKSPVYTYEFSHVPDWAPIPPNWNRKCFTEYSCHAMELPYVFHSQRLSFLPVSRRFSPEEEVMSQHIMDYWTAFAAGDVNGANPPLEWPLFSGQNQTLLNLNTKIFLSTWDSETCDFWDKVGYDYPKP